jgi:hypothetical protein
VDQELNEDLWKGRGVDQKYSFPKDGLAYFKLVNMFGYEDDTPKTKTRYYAVTHMPEPW